MIFVTLDALRDPNGDDYNLLTTDEKEFEDNSRVSYTNDDNMILRQFEGASMPAKMFLQFLHDKRNAPPYFLFEARMAIQSTFANAFAIVSGWLGLWSAS
jgi:hypothetical protein